MQRAVGLDFGTTNSAIAVATADDTAQLATFVPAVKHVFEQKFSPDRLRSGGELTSVATGLALCALRPSARRSS